MMSFKRALLLSALLLFCIFYLYPRSHSPSTFEAEPSPASLKEHGTPGEKTPTNQPPAHNSKPISKDLTDRPRKVSSGADTPTKQQQTSISNLANLPLKEQLVHQFPYHVQSKFPAYIWQTWKYTPASAEFKEEFRITEASWTEKHPDFVHEVITDQVANHLIRHLYSGVPDVLDAYDALPLPILKADFFRYLILLARGGIYADIDTLALKPATEWLSDNFKLSDVGMVVGIEADPDREDWSQWYSRRIQFCQWTIQSKPGHPVLREIVANITMETLDRKKAKKLSIDHDNVVEWTGPAVWTDAVFEYFNDETFFDMSASTGGISWKNFTGMKEPKKVGDVVVLPITSFSPGVGQMGAGEIDDPMAFVHHNFEGSWKPESERINPPSK
ncbi:uncharacterized protein LAJ45_09077 [Morchella importuna]|uniref:uncharacterized protein n=1 Tax=Morchella importuna TaxID=1174673 RepID=UPI001E8E7899|nr:uncharacterized protein LAJ45_09077 [Morchella importuna]KAH8146996.1 hypothetical protein LAJ45_09077 [Morchella importuna]